jgi:2-polyprenyl-3-methyl-5-hydroxy-6-metoxy-1,4-benzoquinol methylase
VYFAGRFEDEIKKRTNKIYEREYWNERNAKEAIESNYTNQDSLTRKGRWKSQLEFCEPFISKKNVLELGAGRGQNLYFFQKEGYKVRGIEPDNQNAKLINAKLSPEGSCTTGVAEKFETSRNFDLVWMSHVLEHVTRPDKVFENVNNVLNFEGLFFVEVPNCDCFEMINASFDRNPSTFGFTKKSLEYLAKNFGFEIQKTQYYNTYHTKIDKGFRAVKKFLKINPSKTLFHQSIASLHDGKNLRILFKKSS